MPRARPARRSAGALGWSASKLSRIELASGHALYIDDAETHQYQLGFDALVAESLDPVKARDLIAKTMRESCSA